MKKIILIIAIFGYFGTFAQHTIAIQHKYYDVQFDTIFCAGILNHYTQTIEHYNMATLKRKGAALTEFHVDPLIPKRFQKVGKSDYASYNAQFKGDKSQTMDIGHEVPYEAMAFDSTAAEETMYFQSNTQFQISFFNEHQWAFVEKVVLDSIGSKYNAEVYTGVLISLSHPKKWHEAFIPDYYFKVSVYNGQTEAWLGSNTPSNKSTKVVDIVLPVQKLKSIILQYYPNLKIPF
jgi:DNA/RNA endonuclease G (NUC1)